MTNSYKDIYLLRGIPGSGKTTVANKISRMLDGAVVVAADDYFTDMNGNYNWDPKRIHVAHAVCKERVEKAMRDEEYPIIVHNTFTKESEMKDYFDLAKDYGYTVFTLIVENRHGSNNAHNVPQETLDKMRERFSVKL